MKSAAVTLVTTCLLLLCGILSPASTVTRGQAFVYPASAQGKRLSTGEIFRQDRLTAGHASIPLGSVVRVINLANQRSVDVLVNDRWNGNTSAIFISQAAADIIGLAETQSVIDFEILAHPISVNSPVRPVAPADSAFHPQQAPGLYFLEFASYRNSIQSNLLARKLTSRGAPCKTVQDPDGLYHVISDGFFTSLEDASTAYHLVAKNVGYIATIKKI